MSTLIIGEHCVDKFVYCDFTRLNPEAPTPVGKIINTVINNGMAGNVAEHFDNLKLPYKFITQQQPIHKIRYVDSKSNYILLRVDEEPLVSRVNLNIDYSRYDLIIISDYCKGFLAEEDIASIIHHARLNGINVFLDTKKILGAFSEGAWVKINEKEYQDNLARGGKIDKNKTIITLGANGAKFQDTNYPQSNKVEVRDVVGAGDTFLVFLSIYYNQTQNIEFAIIQANHYAAIACSKRGVFNDFGPFESAL